MGFYAKKIFQTAPVTSVTESTLESNSDVNVPTVKAVVDGLGRRQLLINNNFQVWQRGESFDFDKTTSKKKTADMYTVYTATNGAGDIFDLTIKKENDNFIALNNLSTSAICTIFQKIKFVKKENKNLTLSFRLKADREQDLQCALVFYKNDIIVGTFYKDYIAKTMMKEQCFAFDITNIVEDVTHVSVYINTSNREIVGNQRIEIEYVDLFEGNIAYPHVKEDYSIELMKCRTKIKTVAKEIYITIPTIFTFYDNYLIGFIESNFDSKASVITNGTYTLFGINGGNQNKANLKFNNISYDYRNGYLRLGISNNDFGMKNGDTCLIQTETNETKLILTCEPL